jgi:hypothetical protein
MPKNHHERRQPHNPLTTNPGPPNAPDGREPPPDESTVFLLELVNLSPTMLAGIETGDPLALRHHDGVYIACTLIGSRIGEVKASDAEQLVGSAVRRVQVHSVGVHPPSCIIEVTKR